MPFARHPYSPRRAPGPQRGNNHFPSRRPDDRPAPKSTAWLQAEQLFSAAPPPEPHADATPVDVQVRRNRAVASNAAPSMPAHTGVVNDKAPRVFRVEAPAAVSTPAPAPAELQPEPAQAARPVLRTRRLSAERQPGPVLQLFTAPQAEPLDLEEAMELRHLLADVNPVLADVERAKTFQFIDDALVQRWSAVTQAIEQLHANVRNFEASAGRVEDDVAA